MMNDNVSLENLMTEEDMNELAKSQYIKKNIMKNLGIENFINIVRDIIDESEIFEFTSAVKRKFINQNTPIFTIRQKNFQPYKASQLNDSAFIDSEIDKIVECINKDILRHTTEHILNTIKNDERLNSIYNDISNDIRDIIWTTIFEIKVSPKDNIIYIQYCI